MHVSPPTLLDQPALLSKPMVAASFFGPVGTLMAVSSAMVPNSFSSGAAYGLRSTGRLAGEPR